MRRVTGAAALAMGVLAGTALAPRAARADATPVVPNPQQFVYSISPQDHVHTIGSQDYVYTINLGDSVQSMQSETQQGGKTNVTIDSDVLFAFDKATLTAAAKKTLDSLAGQLSSAKGDIKVDGYTDAQGSDAYNLTLSKQRAQAVSSYLSAKAGGKKIIATGHGEADPVAPNTKDGKDNPDGRAKNRRVTIQY